MAAAAHDEKFAKKADISQGVARDYHSADLMRRQRTIAKELRK